MTNELQVPERIMHKLAHTHTHTPELLTFFKWMGLCAVDHPGRGMIHLEAADMRKEDGKSVTPPHIFADFYSHNSRG